VDETKDLRIGQVLDALDEVLGPHIFPAKEDGSDPRLCPTCGTGRLSIKIGRFGAFVGCSNYPECRYTRTFSASAGSEGGTRVLGKDPETGLDVSVRSGRFGPYIQLGEAAEGEKPKRSSLPKGASPDSLTLEQALALLSLPREIGLHPEDSQPIVAGIGRYGPYVQHGKTYANLDSADDVLTIGLNRAVSLIADKASKGGRGRRQAEPGRSLGEYPEKGGDVVVKSGRYGPYVSHGGINATLPPDKSPDTITLGEAVALIEARAEKSGGAPAKRPAARRKVAKAAETAARPKAKAKTGATKARPAVKAKPTTKAKPAAKTKKAAKS
jgi:DNA topoisomerase-1